MLVRVSTRLGNSLPAINREEPTQIVIFNRILFVVNDVYRKVISGHPISINKSTIFRMRKYRIEMINYLPSLKFLTQRLIRKITAITFPLLNDFEGTIIGMLSHGPAPNKSSGRFSIRIAGTAIFSTADCNCTQNENETNSNQELSTKKSISYQDTTQFRLMALDDISYRQVDIWSLLFNNITFACAYSCLGATLLCLH